MVRANNKRLEQILNDLTEVVSDLNIGLGVSENVILSPSNKLKTLTEAEQLDYITKVSDRIKRAFRGDILNLFNSVEEYLAFSLKTSGFTVNNKTIRECLSRALIANGVSAEFIASHQSSLVYRNSMAHRYNEPTTEELIEWWKINNKCYMDLILFIKAKYKNELSNANDMNCF